MSNDSSKSGVVKPPRKWGIGAILLGVVAFIGAQVAVGTVAYAIAGEKLSTSEQFLVYGGATLLTLALLSQLLRVYKATFRDLGLKNFQPKFILYVLAAFPAYMLLSGVCTALVGYLFPGLNLEQKQELGFTDATSTVQMVMVFVSLVVLPPFVEELLFRGLIFRGLLKYGTPVMAALGTSLIFGAAHGQVNVGIDTFALSLVLCFLAYKTESLWPSIMLHATKNLLAFVLVFIINN